MRISERRQPTNPLTLLQYATPEPFTMPRWWRGLLFCHWAALVCCAIGAFVIWRFDVETGVCFGIPVTIAGLVLIGGGETVRNRSFLRVGLLHVGVCGLCFVLVVALRWSPSQARLPLSLIAGIHTFFVTLASIIAGIHQPPSPCES